MAPSVVYTLSLHDALPIFQLSSAGSLGAIVTGEGASAADTGAGTGHRISIFRGCLRAFAKIFEHHFRHPLYNLTRSEEHTSELQSRFDLVCRLLLEKKKNK